MKALQLVPRARPSRFWSYASPVLALALTVLIGVLLLILLGKDPVQGLNILLLDGFHRNEAHSN